MKLLYQEGEIKSVDTIPYDPKDFKVNIYKINVPEDIVAVKLLWS